MSSTITVLDADQGFITNVHSVDESRQTFENILKGLSNITVAALTTSPTLDLTASFAQIDDTDIDGLTVGELFLLILNRLNVLSEAWTSTYEHIPAGI